MDVEKELLEFSKQELSNMIIKLLQKLDEKNRADFVSEFISPKIALKEFGGYDSVVFLKKVEDLCVSCLNRDYYVNIEDIENDYDYYNSNNYCNDFDPGEVFDDCEWAKDFTEYLRIAGVYLKNNNFETAYKAFDLIFNCLHMAKSDEGIFGTAYPLDYIKVIWEDVFDQYYSAIKNCISDNKLKIEKYIEIWINFSERCTEQILKYIDNLELGDTEIIKNIGNIEEWTVQYSLYELLKKIYNKFDKNFDEVNTAKHLLKYNKNFYQDIINGYYNLGLWDDVINVVNEALPQIEDSKIISLLNKQLIDAYENLNMYKQAFEIAEKMFYEGESFDILGSNKFKLYKRARLLAEKLGKGIEFTDSAEKYFQTENGYYSFQNLLNILSFEGKVQKLIDLTKNFSGYSGRDYFNKEDSKHSYLRYTSISLIFRAIGHEEITLPNLKDYIKQSACEGIKDMLRLDEDKVKKKEYLNSAIEILKILVQYHIDAAKRTNYARAADYCGVIKDIYILLNKNAEFKQYYSVILFENDKRRALKEEMKIKIKVLE